jgi:glutathione S-transferase
MTKLLVFPHSHFCEKARWALDYKGIPYKAQVVIPGLHLKTIPKIAPGSSVPVLIHDNGDIVQGSSEIIDYLDIHYPDNPLTPSSEAGRDACQQIERTMDEALGVNIRCILYSALLNYPDFIRQCFTHAIPFYKKPFFRPIAPVLRKKIYQVYVGSPEKVARAKMIFDAAMHDMAKRIEGKPYLVGDSFSRADLSVAAMLSLLTLPPEHPFPWGQIPDPDATAFCEHYRDHPVSQWVNRIYREHRWPINVK